MENVIVPTHPGSTRTRERAVRLVLKIREERGNSHGIIPEVAARLGNRRAVAAAVGERVASIRTHAQVPRPADAQRIAELEREVR